MPAPIVFPVGGHFNGRLSATEFSPPAGSINNDAIGVAVGQEVEYTKHEHLFPIVYRPPNVSTTDVVADSPIIHIARKAAVVVAIEAVVETPATGGDRTITIDLKAGNASTAFASILTSTLSLTNATVARTVVPGTINTSALAAADQLQLSIVVAGAAGNQARGLCIIVWVKEKP